MRMNYISGRAVTIFASLVLSARAPVSDYWGKQVIFRLLRIPHRTPSYRPTN